MRHSVKSIAEVVVENFQCWLREMNQMLLNGFSPNTDILGL